MVLRLKLAAMKDATAMLEEREEFALNMVLRRQKVYAVMRDAPALLERMEFALNMVQRGRLAAMTDAQSMFRKKDSAQHITMPS